MGRQPDVELAHLRGSGRRRRVASLQVPGVLATDEEPLLLLALERRAPAPSGGIAALPARELFSRGARPVIQYSRIGGDVKARPVVVRAEALADGRIPSASRILNGIERRGPHGSRGRLEDRARLLLRVQAGGREGQEQERRARGQSSGHTSPLIPAHSTPGGPAAGRAQCTDRSFHATRGTSVFI